MAFGLFALVAAALFAGAAVYISLVEHPARLKLDDGPLLAQWKPSYKAAAPIQAGLALVGSVLAIVAWRQTGSWPWPAGGLVLLANWPYTLMAIRPTNNRLLATQPSEAGPETRRLLELWGKLHAVRSALGALATGLLAFALLGD